MSETTVIRAVVVRNKLGLHARAASLVVRLATSFQSEITIESEGVEANAKSIMGILMLAAGKGSTLRLSATGVDAADAVDSLARLIEQDRFNEP